MSEEYDLKTVLEEIAKFTPETGYNVCIVDSHAPAGEQLSLVAHFDDLPAAEAKQKEIGNDAVIYCKRAV